MLVRDLPLSHPKRNEVEEVARTFFEDLLAHQDNNGMWHQEITIKNSYTETSGSALILFGLGIMIEKGLLDKKHEANFKMGLKGLMPYIGTDGSVSHTSHSCLCIKNGTKKDYMNHPWEYNDEHAFGPVVLAFSQALKLGIEQLENVSSIGKFMIDQQNPVNPRTYVRYVPMRKKDIAWENDRIAFRVFGPLPDVREKAGSGIDVWAKSVNYPIIDKWYRLNAKGKDYHTDRGEGLDFYHMGHYRGCGGLAIWHNQRPYVAETYSSHRVVKNQDDGIIFTLFFDSVKIDTFVYVEEKTIEMEMGTNFFKVTSTLKCNYPGELTVAIGLTTFGDPQITVDKQIACLTSWEHIKPAQGGLGTAVVAQPQIVQGFATYESDQFMLLKVRCNQAFSYYLGAGWSGSGLFNSGADWQTYVKQEAAESLR
ncbi:MAG: DUF4861 family protein [Bacteroidales bacterium]|nr:DUF4861 family protein [Bacteroidales bacterium]